MKAICQYSNIKEVCPPKYTGKPGRGSGAGSIDGWLEVENAEKCGELCDAHPACSSIEYSNNEKVCNLNWEQNPARAQPFKDFAFCAKPQTRLTQFSVSADRDDFWINKGTSASIFTQIFFIFLPSPLRSRTLRHTRCCFKLIPMLSRSLRESQDPWAHTKYVQVLGFLIQAARNSAFLRED
eukprot:TRINITY_DN5038_c0_g1_i2.p1 TRINITY_DN5038_c0_g1~~TRINITY_DN5038_c0_g1_i2.p1  ORF type:complete len:182 (-),score=30.67 TRINITY_DN5038_c0_g1_i2:253-798(-)